MAKKPGNAVEPCGTTELHSPIKVAVIDVASPLADLDCTRPSGPPYLTAWILVCRSARPLGSITIPLDGPVITKARLEHELRGQLKEVEASDHHVETSALARASIVIPTNFARRDQLLRCVERLTKLDHPDYEIIVVDNRPEKTAKVDIPGARIVHEPRPGISAAQIAG